MKGISLMSPDEARDRETTVREITGLLQCGGEAWRKRNNREVPARAQVS